MISQGKKVIAMVIVMEVTRKEKRTIPNEKKDGVYSNITAT